MLQNEDRFKMRTATLGHAADVAAEMVRVDVCLERWSSKRYSFSNIETVLLRTKQTLHSMKYIDCQDGCDIPAK